MPANAQTNTYKVRYVKCPFYSQEGRYAEKGVAIMPRADGNEFCTCCGGINRHQVPLNERIIHGTMWPESEFLSQPVPHLVERRAANGF